MFPIEVVRAGIVVFTNRLFADEAVVIEFKNLESSDAKKAYFDSNKAIIEEKVKNIFINHLNVLELDQQKTEINLGQLCKPTGEGALRVMLESSDLLQNVSAKFVNVIDRDSIRVAQIFQQIMGDIVASESKITPGGRLSVAAAAVSTAVSTLSSACIEVASSSYVALRAAESIAEVVGECKDTVTSIVRSLSTNEAVNFDDVQPLCLAAVTAMETAETALKKAKEAARLAVDAIRAAEDACEAACEAKEAAELVLRIECDVSSTVASRSMASETVATATARAAFQAALAASAAHSSGKKTS